MQVDEGAGVVQAEVVVSPDPIVPVSVDVQLGYVDATSGVDFNFTPQTLNFDPLTTSQLVDIEFLDDGELEYEEVVVLELVNPVGMGIRDPDSVQFDIRDDESARMDTALMSIDMSGCQPQLVAQAGAVTAGVIGVDIDVRVYDRNFSTTWDAPTFSIEGGEAFTVDLETFDLGSRVRVDAQATAGGTTATLWPPLQLPDAPPTIVPGELVVTPSGPVLVVSIAETAITDRLEEVRLRLINTTAATEEPVADPCTQPSVSGAIVAAPTDHVELEACHGVLLELCTNYVVQEGGSP
jgi:hypothetical protein